MPDPATTLNPGPASARLQDVLNTERSFLQKAARLAWAFWKLILGASFCLGSGSILAPILVVGWTYRFMQRTALKHWWRGSAAWQQGMRFQTFLNTDHALQPFIHWPNWFLRQNFRDGLRRNRIDGKPRAKFFLLSLVASLGRNLVTGLRAILNTWILTLLPMVLWAAAWHMGWDNSFNKGYEQAGIGPAVYFIGIFLFAILMFYLPMAQARQAVTGEWGSFFDYRTVRAVIRRRWIYCLLLVILYPLVSLPLVAGAHAFTYFLGHKNPELENLNAAQLLDILNSYLFNWALLGFVAFVVLRYLAARIYASGIKELLLEGKADPRGLEIIAFEKLDLEKGGAPRPPGSALGHAIRWTTSLTGRIVSGIIVLLVSIAFTFQTPVIQFFNAHEPRGFLNQPMIQLPWFDYAPKHLKKAAKENNPAPYRP